MYPQCPLPGHITALYLIAVASCIALFSRSVHFVDADIFIYSMDDPIPISKYSMHDMPAHFGDSLPFEGLKGVVVLADPPSACEPIAPPPGPPPDTFKWVVLIRRYDCSFEEKVRWAQKANYSAAIVHNVNSTELEPMSAKSAADIYIPSVFVSNTSGRDLREDCIYSESNQYYVVINDDLPFNINTHLLLPFAIVVGICFVVMLVFMIVKCIKDRRRQRRHRLPSSSLRKIPTSKFTKGDPYETCAICLEDYQEGEKLRILPCSHAYHTKCIDPWLTRNRRVCPVCKRKVFAHDEHDTDSESDSDSDDTAPLVRSGGSHTTQGGTFVQQTENPFVVANRAVLSGSMSSLSSAGSSGLAEGGTFGRVVQTRGSSVAAAAEAECLDQEDHLPARQGLHSINSVPELTAEGEEGASAVANDFRVEVGGANDDEEEAKERNRRQDLVV